MADDDAGARPAGFCDSEGRPSAESRGEALLGRLLDRGHLLPPDLVGPLVAQEATAAGVTEIGIYLQDFDQVHLQPLPGRGLSGERAPIDGGRIGEAFRTDRLVEQELPDG